MTRLYLFVEGQTEQTYGDTVLKKHLAAFGVYAQGPVLIAQAQKERRDPSRRGKKLSGHEE